MTSTLERMPMQCVQPTTSSGSRNLTPFQTLGGKKKDLQHGQDQRHRVAQLARQS